LQADPIRLDYQSSRKVPPNALNDADRTPFLLA